MYNLIIIGGGAAGFFAACQLKEMKPEASVLILEKTDKLLSKVRISGGGRCNVTHNAFDINTLIKNYPRGEKELRTVFAKFGVEKTIKWFEKHQVFLKTEADNRMFPISDSSETIIDLFLNLTQKYKIQISKNSEVISVVQNEENFTLTLANQSVLNAKNILVATGGSPKLTGYWFLMKTSCEIISPVPSLFAFDIPKNPMNELSGITVEKVKITILETKQSSEGSLLITHKGLSGPAILKLSALAARELHSLDYQFSIKIQWMLNINEDQLRDKIEDYKKEHIIQKIANAKISGLPQRLWQYLLTCNEVDGEKKWADLSKKDKNNIVQALLYFVEKIDGKTTNKEEFVTSGGILKSEIDFKTMEYKKSKGLFFAGEVIDIDGVTGGFNFQSCWSTAFVAATEIANRI